MKYKVIVNKWVYVNADSADEAMDKAAEGGNMIRIVKTRRGKVHAKYGAYFYNVTQIFRGIDNSIHTFSGQKWL